MRTTLTRTFQALCALTVVALLSACGGATSTVDPFKPTRVIGLGDGYALATNSVVAQVASNFGQSNVISQAADQKMISDLAAQIDNVIANNGGFTSGDLVVISVGTFDVKANQSPTISTEVPELILQIQRLLNLNVKHVLVMPVLALHRTPWGSTSNPAFSSAATSTFNSVVNTQLSNNFGGRSPNPVIYGDTYLSPISSQFLSMTDATPLWVSPFNHYDYNVSCTGCLLSASLFDSSTSNIYLSAAGMQWAGNLLYAATAQGWR